MKQPGRALTPSSQELKVFRIADALVDILACQAAATAAHRPDGMLVSSRDALHALERVLSTVGGPDSLFLRRLRLRMAETRLPVAAQTARSRMRMPLAAPGEGGGAAAGPGSGWIDTEDEDGAGAGAGIGEGDEGGDAMDYGGSLLDHVDADIAAMLPWRN